MSFVIDASAAAAWLMPDERVFDLRSAVQRHGDVSAPMLFWAEIRNLLLSNERRNRLTEGMAEEMLEIIGAIGIALDTEPSSAHVIALARRHQLTVYDAIYLDLAMRRRADLATFDRQLIAAAEREGVRLVS